MVYYCIVLNLYIPTLMTEVKYIIQIIYRQVLKLNQLYKYIAKNIVQFLIHYHGFIEN